MERNSVKKLFAVGIILLFFGVTLIPSITSTVVKTASEDDLVVVTSQAYGMSGCGDTTVRLTAQHFQDLEQYLTRFRARLNQTTTSEEAALLFKEAVVEFDKYGLLPQGMSVKQAQHLVMSRYVLPPGSSILKTNEHTTPLHQENIQNQLCLVAGDTTHNYIFGPIKSSLFVLLLLLMNTMYFIAEAFDSLGLVRVAGLFGFLGDVVDSVWNPVRLLPFEVGGLVTFGQEYARWEEETVYITSKGWVSVQGLQGAQSLNGSFYGTMRKGLLGLYYGLSGFTGIVLRPWKTGRLVFLGSALRASISYDHL